MDCDRFLELLSARLDGALTEEEERELEEHLALCPDCRAVGAHLSALQGAFPDLEEVPAPEGFAQGVMDRIREESRPKVIPLFRRPQVRALAGLAACLVLAVGLYGASRPRDGDNMAPTARGLDQSVQLEDGDGPRVNATLVNPEPSDVPGIAPYTAPEAVDEVTPDSRKAAPNPAADGLDGTAAPPSDAIITFKRLPEGWEELFPGATSPNAMQVSAEEARAFLYLLEEQGIAYEIEGPGKIEILGRSDENSLYQLLLVED